MNLRPLALALTLTLLTACGGGSQNDLAKCPGVLRMQLDESPESFDPRAARSLNAMTISKMLFDGLTRIDSSGRPLPSVAERIDVSKDGLTYTFHLRESSWTDGHPVTAHDFEYSWKSSLSPSTASESAGMLFAIKGAKASVEGLASPEEVGVRARDSLTLVVELEQPTPYFLELTALPCYFPVPRHLEARGKPWTKERKLVCNGPFLLDHAKANSDVSVRKNNYYWDADAVELEGIYMPVIPDEQTALYLYDRGELDWVGSPLGSFPADLVPRLKEEGKLHTYAAAATLWYKCNTERPPLNHPKVRRALAYAIDRQALIDHVVPLGQTPATTPVPPLMGLRAGVAYHDSEIVQARQLFEEGLHELGLTRTDLPPIRLLCSPSERYQKIAQALQDQWRERLGLQVDIETAEFKMLLARMTQHDYDIAGKIWFADFNDPTSFLTLYKYRDDPVTGGMNETGWHNAEYTRLLDRAATTVDPELRNQYLRRAEDILVEEMPVIPVYHHTLCYLKNDSVSNVSLPPSGSPDFKWARR